MQAIRSPKDFFTGIVYLVVGVAGILIGRDYSFGSAGRMGPGYFPAVISWVLVLFAAISILRSFQVDGEPIGRLAWKSMALIIGSIVAFGLLLPVAGFIIAMVAMILLAASASEKFRFDWVATLGLVVFVSLCALVFIWGLGVPMPLVGSWFRA